MKLKKRKLGIMISESELREKYAEVIAEIKLIRKSGRRGTHHTSALDYLMSQDVGEYREAVWRIAVSGRAFDCPNVWPDPEKPVEDRRPLNAVPPLYSLEFEYVPVKYEIGPTSQVMSQLEPRDSDANGGWANVVTAYEDSREGME